MVSVLLVVLIVNEIGLYVCLMKPNITLDMVTGQVTGFLEKRSCYEF